MEGRGGRQSRAIVGNRNTLAGLTASMPDSCMPMLMTTTLRSCQRTDGSSSSCHTETVSTDDRERCSSCISSISAWMLHLARYHFRAGMGSSCQEFTSLTFQINGIGGIFVIYPNVLPTRGVNVQPQKVDILRLFHTHTLSHLTPFTYSTYSTYSTYDHRSGTRLAQ